MKAKINVRLKLTMALTAFLAIVGAQSIQGQAAEIQSRKVIGEDTRTQITNTTESPYQSLTFITATTKSGSGAVIGKNTILTAAHVVEDIVTNPEEGSNYVIPGRDDKNFPYGKFKMKEVHIPLSYMENPNAYNDLAVVVVEPSNGKSVGDTVPPLPLKLTNTVDKGVKVAVTGYPGDKPRGTMWEGKGEVVGERHTAFYYDADTMGGHSGSAVLNDQNQIIGVHTSGSINYNWGLKLNDEFYAFIQSHLK